MADNLTIEGVSSTGLTLKNYDEILAEVQSDLTKIYAQDGEPINFDSETQDGQFTNILAQIGSDIRELAREVYNSFNPDNCSGVVQDERYAINYIERKSGTFTIQNIDIVTNAPVTLQGLDNNYNDPTATAYTISDDAGQLWFLISTTTFDTPGLQTDVPFRSQNYGLFVPAINSITNQVTVEIGVTSVTNSEGIATPGEEQETDGEFRVRRTRSTSTHGQNNLDALLGALLNLDTVTDAYVHNNATNSTDETGTPANTVWAIVEGGSDADIGALIYQYSCGKMTKGSTTVNMTSLAGQTFPTSFDRAVTIPLSIKFDYETETSVGSDTLESIADYIAKNLRYKLNETAETSKITEIARLAISSVGGRGYALNVQVSTDTTDGTDGTWESLIEAPTLKDKFVTDPTRIYITNTVIST